MSFLAFFSHPVQFRALYPERRVRRHQIDDRIEEIRILRASKNPEVFDLSCKNVDVRPRPRNGNRSIFNTSGSFLANFILYIWMYVCIRILSILHYIEQTFPKTCYSFRHREQSCVHIKEKKKSNKTNYQYTVLKERIKSPLYRQAILYFFASYTTADHNVNLAYTHIILKLSDKREF